MTCACLMIAALALLNAYRLARRQGASEETVEATTIRMRQPITRKILIHF